LEITNRKRSPSNGFVLRTTGSEPSARRTKPSGRSFASTNVRTFSALTSRPNATLSRDAMSA
jgi:hypothetical protein